MDDNGDLTQIARKESGMNSSRTLFYTVALPICGVLLWNYTRRSRTICWIAMQRMYRRLSSSDMYIMNKKKDAVSEDSPVENDEADEDSDAEEMPPN